MGKQRIFGVMVLAALTAAVLGANRFWTPEQETVPPAEEAAPAVTVLELSAADAAEDGTAARNPLPDLDISAVSAAMSEEERAAFETYLPILRGEEGFRWVSVVRPDCAEPEREPLDVTMAAYCDARYGPLELEEPPEALTLYGLAVQDIDGDGGAELVLHFRDLGGHYLVLRREDETVWGAVYVERGFQGLQKNGVYASSGGVGYTYYYQTSFRDGVFEERELGHKLYDGEGAFDCELDGQKVTEEVFDGWRDETLLVGNAAWYAPDGTVLETDLLPGLDVSSLKAAMPEADYKVFEDYLPVLRGEETFRWVAGPYDGYPNYDWEPFDADMAKVHEKLWDGFGGEIPETLTLDRLAVQDIDGDGGAELILLFQDGAYNYLVLHREGDAVYGTSLYVRWFEGLQKNGVYIGAGGAGYSTYYQMAFQNGRFEQRELGVKIDGASVCYRELDGQEVTEEVFDAWLAENMVGGVTWYAPDGTVCPDGM